MTGGMNAAMRTRTSLELEGPLEDLKIRVRHLEAECVRLSEEVEDMRRHGASVVQNHGRRRGARERNVNVGVVGNADSARQDSEEGLARQSRQSHQHEDDEGREERQRT
ncbi:hypothetical protein CVT25_005374 [Psilocybe cyanescens]|uniref:Uncharacterized protein n=1 Tax=Psilocybe cyanescens TaxID=93625 RepID=A0A409XKS3_PSICY|nr:hypothetical protein CVT25_005374 [Psilocybe cyanescens]